MPRGYKEGSILKREFKRTVRGREKTETRLYVRVRYTDSRGIPREKKRRISQPSDAPEARRSIYAEIKKELDAPKRGEQNVTFAELASYYEDHYLVAPEYVGGVKIKGLRSYKTGKSNLKLLRKAIDPRTRLRSFTNADLQILKGKLLRAPVVHTRKERNDETGEVKTVETKRARGIVSVHRHLQMLRRMFSIACARGWMDANPFSGGEVPLISAAEEEERMTILSREEEARLLAACTGRRKNLAPALIVAVETALREGEQFTLTRRFANLDAGLITVVSYKGRRRKVRHVPVSERCRAALVELLAKAGDDPDAPVFPVASVRTAFEAARDLAGLPHVRWHDLRHTAITRMLAATRDAAKVMKISGHDNWKTFLRYVNINEELAREIAAQFDAYRGDVVEEEATVH